MQIIIDRSARFGVRRNITAFWIFGSIIIAPSGATAASVAERYGNIEYIANDGSTRQLTANGNNGEPVLSPDGRTVAFVHVDAKSSADGAMGAQFTSLWVADGPTGETKRLIGPSSNPEPQLNFALFEHPLFSLDGDFIYVSATAWATSAAVHQVSVATGKEHFVIDGSAAAIIRTGPYRGNLIVQRHMYYQRPKLGSYDPIYIVRPDAKQAFAVPGSETDGGVQSLSQWLGTGGWKAW